MGTLISLVLAVVGATLLSRIVDKLLGRPHF